MFPYDPQIRQVLATPPQTIAQVLATMQTLDGLMADHDGLKWFNWLYMQVTDSVEQRVSGGGFVDPKWLAELDVQFARLYFSALTKWIAGKPMPGCWSALFSRRQDGAIARIQFAMAGINAHINHDLAIAIDNTCKVTRTHPAHGTAQYNDYTGVNGTLDRLVDLAKSKLMVRLAGDALPAVSHLEDTIAGWNVAAAREGAWVNAEVLWRLADVPVLYEKWMGALDGLTTVAGKALLVAVPAVGRAVGA
jgi:hypothetical protein